MLMIEPRDRSQHAGQHGLGQQHRSQHVQVHQFRCLRRGEIGKRHVVGQARIVGRGHGAVEELECCK